MATAKFVGQRFGLSALASNAQQSYLRQQRFLTNLIDGGKGRIGNPPDDPITLNGQPYQARIRVFDEISARLVREIWSAPDGTWEITYLRTDTQYLVVCYNGSYPALAWDHITPEPMTP